MPGIYDESITMKDWVDVEGSGWDNTQITSSGRTVQTLGTTANTIISKLTILTTGFGISAQGGSTVVIDNVRIISTDINNGKALVPEESGNIKAYRCYIDNIYVGGYHYGNGDLDIEYCTFGTTGDANVRTMGGSGTATLLHNQFGSSCSSPDKMAACGTVATYGGSHTIYSSYNQARENRMWTVYMRYTTAATMFSSYDNHMSEVTVDGNNNNFVELSDATFHMCAVNDAGGGKVAVGDPVYQDVSAQVGGIYRKSKASNPNTTPAEGMVVFIQNTGGSNEASPATCYIKDSGWFFSANMFDGAAGDYYVGENGGLFQTIPNSSTNTIQRVGMAGYGYPERFWIQIDTKQNYPQTQIVNSPQTALTVTQSGTGDILNLFDGSTGVFTILDGGNVGIGTLSPTEKLEVIGKVKGTELCIGADCRSYWPAGGGNGSDSDWIITGSNMYSGVLGNVGIGTASPAVKLDIRDISKNAIDIHAGPDSGYNSGQIRLYRYNDSSPRIQLGLTGGNDFEIRGGDLLLSSGNAAISSDASGLTITTGNWKYYANQHLVLDPSGNVGIGTTNPVKKLDVVGDIKTTGYVYGMTGLCIGSDCRASWPGTSSENASGWNDIGTQVGLVTSTDNVSANTLFVDNTNGRVGIGTTSPTQKLDVAGNINIGGNYLYLGNDANLYRPATDVLKTDDTLIVGGNWLNATNVNALNQLCLGGNCRTSWPTEAGVSGSGTTNSVAKFTANNMIGDSIIKDTGNVTIDTLFVDASNNRVGIGTISPKTKLDVKGSMSIGSVSAISGRLLCWTNDNRIGYCTSTVSGSTCGGCYPIN